jgi:hypothetical protein
LSNVSMVTPVEGWELEYGKTEVDATLFASIRKVDTQVGRIFYADKDPLIVSFLLALAAKTQGDAAASEAEADRVRRRCADMLVLSNASLMLMAGDMTEQELRTTQAVLGGLHRQMLKRDQTGTVPCVEGATGSPRWHVRFR